MRKEYGKALRKLFAEQMRETMPQFEAVKVQSMYFWPGDRAFRWAAGRNLTFWIVLSPDKKGREEFTLLVGWSRRGRYPELSVIPCPEGPSPERKEFASQEYLTRLPSLWTDRDVWWVVERLRVPRSISELQASLKPISAEAATAAVAPRVREAIAELQEHALPYFEELRSAVSREED